MRHLLAVLIFSSVGGLGCQKRADTLLSPVDFLDLCKPGGSADGCMRNDSNNSDAFPAGRLDGVHLSPLDIDVSRAHLGAASRDGVFKYEMDFHDATNDVEQLLRQKLGEPLKDRQPPIVPSAILVGDLYWVTPDGLWEYARNHHVAWYSDAFHSSDPRGFIVGEWGKMDKYISPAPISAPLWTETGLLLIGSDVEPVKRRKKSGS